MAETLHIALLGGPSVTVGERPVTAFVSSKAQALVFYLAATRGVHTRDALAGLLWSDVPDSVARKNLRDVLSNLRKLIGPYLSITRRTVSLNADAPCQVDSWRLSAALEAAREGARPHPPEVLESLARAADLCRGEFLAGFYISEAPPL